MRRLINLNNRLLLCVPQRKTDYPFIIDSSSDVPASSIAFISKYICSASFQLAPVLKIKNICWGFIHIEQPCTIIPLLLLGDVVGAAHVNLYAMPSSLTPEHTHTFHNLFHLPLVQLKLLSSPLLTQLQRSGYNLQVSTQVASFSKRVACHWSAQMGKESSK